MHSQVHLVQARGLQPGCSRRSVALNVLALRRAGRRALAAGAHARAAARRRSRPSRSTGRTRRPPGQPRIAAAQPGRRDRRGRLRPRQRAARARRRPPRPAVRRERHRASTATSSRASAGAARCSRKRGCTARRRSSPSRRTRSPRRPRSPVEPLDASDDGSPRVLETVSESSGGVSLRDAKVVVSGGRGVGSSEAFEIIEELAGLLGGAVGCSRVVTSAGWRPHADQVGQTGHEDLGRPLRRVRHQRRDAAHRRREGREEDPRDQQRPGGADLRERRLRRRSATCTRSCRRSAPSCERCAAHRRRRPRAARARRRREHVAAERGS